MSEKSKGTLTDSRDASDVRAVSLGLWASGLRCIIVYVIAPVVGVFGPFGVGLALVVQAAGAMVCVGGARNLWMRRHRARYVYAAVAAATCLSTISALLTPAGRL